MSDFICWVDKRNLLLNDEEMSFTSCVFNQAVISLRRLTDFLCLDELRPDDVERLPHSSGATQLTCVEYDYVLWMWRHEWSQIIAPWWWCWNNFFLKMTFKATIENNLLSNHNSSTPKKNVMRSKKDVKENLCSSQKICSNLNHQMWNVTAKYMLLKMN